MKNFAKCISLAVGITAFMMAIAPSTHAAWSQVSGGGARTSILNNKSGHFEIIDGFIHALGGDGAVYKWNKSISDSNPLSGVWEAVTGDGGADVFKRTTTDPTTTGNSAFYILGKNGAVYRWDPTGSTPLPGNWTQITKEGARSTDNFGKSGHFEIIGGFLYALGGDGAVYQWGIGLSGAPNPSGGQWNMATGSGGTDVFKRTADGQYFILGYNGAVYRWDSSWTQITKEGARSSNGESKSGHFEIIDGFIYALGHDGAIYKWSKSITETPDPNGGSWITPAVTGGAATDVFTRYTNGAFYAMGQNGAVYRWDTAAAGPFALTVTKAGTGSGTVTGAVINCGSACSATFVSGTSITLTATPDSGSTFTGWSGDCSGTGACTLTMNAAKNVTATFSSAGGANTPPFGSIDIPQGNTTVSGTITVEGWVEDKEDAQIDANQIVFKVDNTAYVLGTAPLGPLQRYDRPDVCADAAVQSAHGITSAQCTAKQPLGIKFTLNTSTFTNGPRIISLTAADSDGLTTNNIGIRTITVSGGVVDTTAPATITNLVASAVGSNQAMLLWAAPGEDGPGSTGIASSYDIRFSLTNNLTTNWSSAASVTTLSASNMIPSPATPGSSQNMTIAGFGANTTYYFAIKTKDEASNESALSNIATFTHTVTGGANTPPFGSIDIPQGNTTVSGTITVDGWMVDKEDNLLSLVELNVDGNTVPIGSTVRYNRPDVCANSGVQQQLGLTESQCNAQKQPMGVRFEWQTATLSNGPHLIALKTADSGSLSARIGERTVTVTGGVTNAYVLTVTKAGTGSGTVTSSPAGINCGSDCSEYYTNGTSVTLTAAAASGSTFTGWSGDCSGSGTSACALTMNAAKSVTATFASAGGGGNDGSATPALQNNDLVKTTVRLKIRSHPSTSGATRPSSPASTGATGRINCSATPPAGVTAPVAGTNCPTVFQGAVWWYVDYDTEDDGWSVEQLGESEGLLVKIAAVTDGNDGSATSNLVDRERIKVTAEGDDLAVRSGPSPLASLIRRVPTDTRGRINCSLRPNPITNPYCPLIQNGLVWWFVDYDFGQDGWSAEKFVNSNIAVTQVYLAAESGVVTFDFSLANGGNRTVVKGSSVTNPITATLLSGTTQSVSFSTSGLPTGATAAYSPPSCNPTCTSTLTISTLATTPVGTYPILVTGTAGSVVKATTFTLTVTAPGTSFDFSLANGGNRTVVKGSSVTNPITATLLSGTTQSVSFSTSGLPTGATAAYSPPSCNPTCTSTLTISTLATTPVGTYPILVTGAAGSVVKATTFTLTVTAPGTSFDFSLANGGNRTVVKGSSVTNPITATLLSGTTQSVSFSTSGLPTGATAAYSPPSCNPTCTSTLTISTLSTTPTGTYPILVTGTAGSVVKATAFTLTVTAPAISVDFRMDPDGPGPMAPQTAETVSSKLFLYPAISSGEFNTNVYYSLEVIADLSWSSSASSCALKVKYPWFNGPDEPTSITPTTFTFNALSASGRARLPILSKSDPGTGLNIGGNPTEFMLECGGISRAITATFAPVVRPEGPLALLEDLRQAYLDANPGFVAIAPIDMLTNGPPRVDLLPLVSATNPVNPANRTYAEGTGIKSCFANIGGPSPVCTTSVAYATLNIGYSTSCRFSTSLSTTSGPLGGKTGTRVLVYPVTGQVPPPATVNVTCGTNSETVNIE